MEFIKKVLHASIQTYIYSTSTLFLKYGSKVKCMH